MRSSREMGYGNVIFWHLLRALQEKKKAPLFAVDSRCTAAAGQDATVRFSRFSIEFSTSSNTTLE